MKEEIEQSQPLRAPFSEVTNPTSTPTAVQPANKTTVAQQQSKRREAIMGKALGAKQQQQPKQREIYEDLSKVLFVDSQVLNYATFYPGKLLGSTLTVGNLTNCEQIVELSVDASSYTYSKRVIRSKF